jgi:hypothetical protein
MKSRENKRGKKEMPLLVERPKLSSATEHNLSDKHQNLRADYRWISTDNSLRKKYNNKYVAVKDREVVLSDENAYKLIARLKALGFKADNFAVEFVSEHPDCFLL